MTKDSNKPAILSMKDEDSFFSSILKSGFKKEDLSQEETKATPANYKKHNRVVLTIDPNKATNWAYPDRPECELGNLDALGESMQINGQAVPCVARPYKSSKAFDFEIIMGERRWRSAKQRGITLDVEIRELSDQEATILQALENLEREDLSQYARGIHLAKILEAEILTQTDLQNRFKLSKVAVNRLMAYSQIPTTVIDAIGESNMKNISPRLAVEIRALCNKGLSKHIITLAEKIGTGKIGPANLKQKIDALLEPNHSEQKTSEMSIKDREGNTSFSIKFRHSGKIEITAFKQNKEFFFSDSFKERLVKILSDIHMDT